MGVKTWTWVNEKKTHLVFLKKKIIISHCQKRNKSSRRTVMHFVHFSSGLLVFSVFTYFMIILELKKVNWNIDKSLKVVPIMNSKKKQNKFPKWLSIYETKCKNGYRKLTNISCGLYIFTPFFRTISLFSKSFFLNILLLCMVIIQEWF